MTKEEKCIAFLNARSLTELRAYARDAGVSKPTKKSKEALITQIIGIIKGDILPLAHISKRGAPVKNNLYDMRMDEYLKATLFEEEQAVEPLEQEIQTVEENEYLDELTARFKGLPQQQKQMLMHVLDAWLLAKEV